MDRGLSSAGESVKQLTQGTCVNWLEWSLLTLEPSTTRVGGVHVAAVGLPRANRFVADTWRRDQRSSYRWLPQMTLTQLTFKSHATLTKVVKVRSLFAVILCHLSLLALVVSRALCSRCSVQVLVACSAMVIDFTCQQQSRGQAHWNDWEMIRLSCMRYAQPHSCI